MHGPFSSAFPHVSWLVAVAENLITELHQLVWGRVTALSQNPVGVLFSFTLQMSLSPRLLLLIPPTPYHRWCISILLSLPNPQSFTLGSVSTYTPSHPFPSPNPPPPPSFPLNNPFILFPQNLPGLHRSKSIHNIKKKFLIPTYTTLGSIKWSRRSSIKKERKKKIMDYFWLGKE